MIIDLILDRKDGQPYNAREFYNDVMQYAETWPEMCQPITFAMDYGDENDVRRQLCAYIDGQDYNPAIKKYINSVEWLEPRKIDAKEFITNIWDVLLGNTMYCTQQQFTNNYRDFFVELDSAAGIIRIMDDNNEYHLTLQKVWSGQE